MIHELLKDITPGELAGLIATLVTVFGGIAVIVRRIWPMARKTVGLVNALVGEDPDGVLPGQKRRPSVLERMAALEAGQEAGLAEITRTARIAEGAQAAAENAARQAVDSAHLVRQVSDVASQAAASAQSAASDAAAAREVAESVAAQLRTNGGTSLRDAMDRVERQLQEHIRAVERRAEVPPES